MRGHDLCGADIAARRLPEMGVDRKTTEQVVRLVREHMYDLTGQARESRIRRKIQSMGYAAFDRLILLREADFLGSGKESRPVATAERFRAIRDAMQRGNAPMQVGDLDITGCDLMAAYDLRGAEIGRVLHALLDFCALHPAQNKKQHLLRLAPRFFAPGQAEGGTR